MSLCLGLLSLLAAPAEVRERQVYATVDGLELWLDLYLPSAPAAAPRPAVLFFHGGGWSGGNPGQFAPQATWLAERGVIAASARYRLVREAPFPACLEDCLAALLWLVDHAAELNLDADRLAVAGGSAGGHLAAMVAFADGFEATGAPGRAIPKVRAYVGFNPVLDLVAMGRAQPRHPTLMALLKVGYDERPAAWERASPMTYVGAGDPPALVMYGGDDRLLPADVMAGVARRFADAGVVYETDVAADQPHGYFNQEPWRTRTLERAWTFLRTHLLGEAP